jgi:hypothetical protein
MKMTKNLKWRLKTPPTASEVRDLVQANVLTKDEAREILFTTDGQSAENLQSLKSEINFLRELVEKMVNKNNSPATVWTYASTAQYKREPWYPLYSTSLGANTTITGSTSSNASVNAVNLVSSGGTTDTTFNANAPLHLPRYDVK